MVDAPNPFSKISADELDREALLHGFKRKGQRNWVRRTCDFVQLVNLQHSQWSADDSYLNFAMWPLAMGEPPTFAESKFQFRTRAERLDVNDLPGFFSAADKLRTLADLREAVRASEHVLGLVRKELRALLL
ncbi:DUF4304 domain-containing protein [Sphingopyxis sp. KK2]|uniref:DUF4304 domain-containing protein n=1 Tax=Sphingopyxis sp. KK2 TaxID=1855727 RepID=UPI00097E589F|nr:DUF4304 domain-containing protein [Sphingopyxis sp. KK2]